LPCRCTFSAAVGAHLDLRLVRSQAQQSRAQQFHVVGLAEVQHALGKQLVLGAALGVELRDDDLVRLEVWRAGPHQRDAGRQPQAARVPVAGGGHARQQDDGDQEGQLIAHVLLAVSARPHLRCTRP
jgi:hypothetical protein